MAAYYSAIGTATGYTLTDNGGNLGIGSTLNLGAVDYATGSNGTFPVVGLGAGSAAIDAGDPALTGTTDQLGSIRPQGTAVDIGAFEAAPSGVPTAHATTSNVTSPTPNTYQFTVTYTDVTAVQYASVNNNSNAVTITPPSGVPAVAVSFVSATPASDSPSITATYQFTFPAGLGAGADNGTWTVNMADSQVKNTSNAYVPAGTLSTFHVTIPSPTAQATTTNVTSSTPTTYQFTVTYNDLTAIQYASVNNNSNAVTVTPPAGVSPVTVSFVGATPTSDSPSITATYQFTFPAGLDTGTDNGTWAVSVAGSQVENTYGGFVPAGQIGAFQVLIPRTFTITNTNDDTNPGSLRYAFTLANLDAPAADIIQFSNSTTGGATNFYDGSQHTISLSSALPAIVDPLVITGPGASVLTIDAAQTGRVLADSATDLTISGLTLTGGKVSGVGGGIDMTAAGESLTVTNCVISGNSASGAGAALYHISGGTVTITGSTISSNTGSAAIRMNSSSVGGGALILTGSQILNNVSTSNGGALNFYYQGPLTIDHSTIAGNSSSGIGGGIYFFGTGPAGVTVSNSTIANNTGTSGGGIVMDTGSTAVTVTNSSIVGNTATTGSGGGISVLGGTLSTITLDNSIITGNTASSLANGPDIFSAQSVSASYSAIGDSTDGFVLTDLGNNLTDASATPVALHLGTLAPATGPGGTFQMIALGAGSTAVNVGDPAQGGPGYTDERGVARPQGAGVDIGAYERIPGVPGANATTHNVTSTAEPATYQFTVTYIDDATVSYASINGNNNAVTVTGTLNGGGTVNPTVTFVGATPTSDAASITATYQFTIAGGWTGADNGAWSVNMQPNQVKNTNNVYVPAGQIGAFSVSIPTTYTVTSTDDSGPGTLRQAILSANSDAAATPGSPPADTIVFSNSTAGGAINFFDGSQYTISLLGALPAITDPVTITGPGATALTVANLAAGSFQIFSTNPGAAYSVTMSGMTVSGGNSGTGAGVDDVSGSLTLTDMTLTGNSTSGNGGAVAITAAGGTLTLTNDTLTNNTGSNGGGVYVGGAGAVVNITNTTMTGGKGFDGGAIYLNSAATVTLTNSTLANNSGAFGGAISVYSNSAAGLTINSSTLSGNTASSYGGAIYAFGAMTGGFSITNSTIANNKAPTGGGITLASFSGLLNLVSGTVTGNTATTSTSTYGYGGGGIALRNGAGTVSLDNTIISGNTAASSNGSLDISANASGIVQAQYSAIGSTTGYVLNDFGGNLTTADSSPAALHLQPLGFNGGFAQTIAITTGSTAIDTGDPAQGGPGFTDERGIARPQGAGVDIGAFERVPGVPGAGATTHNVTSAAEPATYQFTVTYTDDLAMLYSSINGNNNAVTITPPSGVSPVTVSFVSATPTGNAASITATYQFTVAGGWTGAENGAWTVTMVANQVKNTNNVYVPAGQIGTFNVAIPRTLTVTDPGDAGTGTGNAGDLRYTITQANVDATAGLPDIIVFSNSTAGGATNFYDGTQHTITLASSLPTILDPVTITGPGAALLTIDAAGTGRVLTTDPTTGSATVFLSGLTLTGGVVSGVGGGVDIIANNLTVTDSVITGNSASGFGGGIYAPGSGGTVTVTNSTISANSGEAGGGVFMESSTPYTLNLTNSTIADNVATGTGLGGNGGGIDYYFAGALHMTGSTLSGNLATGGDYGGGGIYFFGTPTDFTISNSTIANNVGVSGGGIVVTDTTNGVMTITNSTITGNSAISLGTDPGYGGGGISIYSGSITINLDNTIVSGNIADNGNTDISAVAGATVNSTYDAIGDATGFTYTPGVGDLPLGADLQLQPLADNGGPTQTVALGAGSAALDVGDPAQGGPGFVDQRGVSRPQGAGVDIGAFELSAAVAPTVTGVTINNGVAQRSMLTTLTVTFSEQVVIGANAFTLTRVGLPNGVPGDNCATRHNQRLHASRRRRHRGHADLLRGQHLVRVARRRQLDADRPRRGDHLRRYPDGGRLHAGEYQAAVRRHHRRRERQRGRPDPVPPDNRVDDRRRHLPGRVRLQRRRLHQRAGPDPVPHPDWQQRLSGRLLVALRLLQPRPAAK